MFTAFILVLLLGGGVAAAVFRRSPPPVTRGAEPGDHWHASYKIFICGKRLANYPTVEGEIHSHGDGFMHIHPQTAPYSGNNASLATFLRLYETSLGLDTKGRHQIIFPTGATFKDGDKCSDGKRYKLELLNKGKKIKGDPGQFLPHQGDAIVIKFGPEGSRTIVNPYNVAHPGTPQQVPEGPAPVVPGTSQPVVPASSPAAPQSSP
jgi:hypothetical protein